MYTALVIAPEVKFTFRKILVVVLPYDDVLNAVVAQTRHKLLVMKTS